MAHIYASTSNEVTLSEKKHAEVSLNLAAECPVLIENDGTLPLNTKKIALYGFGARHTVKGGTGSGDVNTRKNVNVEEGLANAGYEILTTAWIDRCEQMRMEAKAAYKQKIRKISEEAGVPEFYISFTNPYEEPEPIMVTEEDLTEETDTCIYVIARNSGEAADRKNRKGDYQLFDSEKASLEFLAKKYAKLIVVLNVGGVMDLSELKAIDGINAVLLLSQLGNITGDVLPMILSGEVNPSGKLVDTWAKKYEDYPSSAGFSLNDGNVNDEYYAEGIYVGYRYFDTFGVEPLYHFGYGKSYTTFDIQPVSTVVSYEGVPSVHVTVSVTNTGKAAGKETVQVYYSAPADKRPKPYQELAVYEKTELLQPGETETMTLTYAIKDMTSFCERGKGWILDAGTYLIRVGNASDNTIVCGSLFVETKKKLADHKNFFRKDVEFDELTAALRDPMTAPEGMEVITLDTDKIPMDSFTYQGDVTGQTIVSGQGITKGGQEYCFAKGIETSHRKPLTTAFTEKLTMDDILSGKCTVEDLVAQLSIEEMATFCVGTSRSENGSVLGNASNVVPGAAGDTASICIEDRKIKNMILADGPAGLRLQPIFKTDFDGNLLPGGAILGEVSEPFDPKYTDENSITYYQYCTAIPIGWALAMSWNKEMLEMAGSVIGEEMERFGVDLWLAPAMNIHRNPLCGRNFEYYSEDPVVAGKCAGAITRGVQSHPGKGTCIKHFALNSQEENRYFTNSHASERAIREIYIKGFEICVKETQPLSLMTSYNLINGIHAANNYDLLQGLLRDEWGFEGVVMTDWCTSVDLPGLTGESTKYPISASTGCIFAGNDLQMPGDSKNVQDIIDAVKSGKEIDGYHIGIGDLQYNTCNIIRVIARTTL